MRDVRVACEGEQLKNGAAEAQLQSQRRAAAAHGHQVNSVPQQDSLSAKVSFSTVLGLH